MLQVIYNLLHLAWPLRLTDSKPKTLPKYENNSKNAKKKHAETFKKMKKMRKYKNIKKNAKIIKNMHTHSKTNVASSPLKGKFSLDALFSYAFIQNETA
jgi:hypothetical protein